ncbi:MAG: HEAT repeat domain-containing protein [Deltaproteobacteria bacterium]|nr:HEAT repeat domain-containing protein [Deltaproteobacteria bacterium]
MYKRIIYFSFLLWIPSSGMGAEEDIDSKLHSADRKVRIEGMVMLRQSGKISDSQVEKLVEIMFYSDGSDHEAAEDTLRILKPQHALPLLKKAISDPSSWQIRSRAIKTLQNFGARAKDIVPLMAKIALSDSDGGVRSEAALALGNLGIYAKDAVPLLKIGLAHPHAHVRQRAAQSFVYLGKHGKEAAGDLAKSALYDSDAEVRYQSANALGEMGEFSKETVPLLSKALSDPKADIRFEAAVTLERLGKHAKYALAPLLKALVFDKDETVRAVAATAIGSLGEHATDAIPSLAQRAISDPSSSVRFNAAAALRPLAVHTRSAIPILQKALSHPNAETRSNAAFALYSLGEYAGDTVPLLTKALYDSDEEVRSMAALALGNIGKNAKSSVPDLKKLLSDSDSKVRFHAIIALSKLVGFSKDAPSELKKALQDPDDTVRINAASALNKLGKDAHDAFPELKMALSDSHPGVRAEVASALGNLETNSKEIIPLLRGYARYDRNPWVRSSAQLALEKMTDATQPLPEISDEDDLCDALQFIAEKNDVWQQLSGYKSEFHFPADSWDTAIESLQELFNAKTQTLLEDEAPCHAPSQKTLQKFSLSLLSLMERSQKDNDPYWSGVDIYAKIFYLNLLELRGDEEAAKQFRHFLEKDVMAFKTEGIGGSAFNTYAYGATMVALGQNASPSTLQRFEAWVEKSPDPMALPYKPTQALSISRQASAARNVPVYLALYLNRNRSTVNTNRGDQLIEAVSNWHKYAGNLAAEVSQPMQTHSGPHALAPYYFYSSLPYVTSAIKVLERDRTLNTQKKKEISRMKADLRKKLPKLIDSEGLGLLPGGPDYEHSLYYASPAYTYPLYGLALLALLEEPDECYLPTLKNDFGMVAEIH